MFIREFAKQTGLTATTIRYYESVGLIPPPQRAENNYREYTPWLTHNAGGSMAG